MKILEMIATIGVGGAEGLVSDLSIELTKRGGEVKLFLLAGLRGIRGELLKERLTAEGVEVLGLEPRKPSSINNVCRIARLFSEWQPDVVHCHLYSSEVAASFSRIFAKVQPKVFIRTIHNTDIVGSRSKLVSYLLCNLFHYNVACSVSVADSYVNYRGKSAVDTLVTIPNGCNLSESTTTAGEKIEARNELGLPQDAFIFCHVGAFRGKSLALSQKAQDVLLKSYSSAFQQEDNTVLVFAGDGPLREEAEELSRALGCFDRTIFLGNIPESWPLFKASDVFVMPSRHEGLSLALLEAASTGLPVVASDINEIRSLNSLGGWIYCPVDDCTAFARSFRKVIAQYQNIAEQAKEDSIYIRRNYSIEECGKQYLDFFSHTTLTNVNE